MEQNTSSRTREIVAALAVFIIIVAIVATATLTNKKKTSSGDVLGTTASSTTSNSSSSGTANTSSSATYKDGSYTATGSYDSPGGSELIIISVTLQSNVITATSAKSGAGDPEADVYQSQFIGGYKQKVVGKNVNSVRLSRVSGSSLTSQGFNDALAQIKQQAQGS